MRSVYIFAIASVCLLFSFFLWLGERAEAAVEAGTVPPALSTQIPGESGGLPDSAPLAGNGALSTDTADQAKKQLDLAARYVLLGAVVCGVELQDEETTDMLLPLMLRHRESADSLLEQFTSSLDAYAPEARELMGDAEKMSAAKERCPDILQKRKNVLEYFSR